MTVVTIDGPAGAGKSTVAKALARRLGFRFLDTGAMYRAVAWAAWRGGLDWDRPDELAALARQIRISFAGERILLDGEDVSDAIRTSQVTALVRFVADNPDVRQHLVELQRAVARAGSIVTEGRDQGTVAFPNAECKIYLTATAEERARRRVRDLAERGEQPVFADILAQQARRDQEDLARPVGPLMRADDAVEIGTDGLSLEEVVERLEQVVRERLGDSRPPRAPKGR